MKKYKLIKEYPGSPPLNSEIESWMYNYNISKEKEFWEEIIDKNPLKLEVGKEYILEYIHCKSKPQHIKITHFTEQGYPWQERVRDGGCRGIVSPGCYKLIEKVVEKDYDILSLKCLEDDEIFYNNDNGIYKFLFNELEYNLKNGYVIHSVKRLSDSEIFTIKDYVINKKCNSNAFTITGFTLDCNNKHILALGGNGGININKLKPVKKPLFKTFDGVDIFEGDKFYMYAIPFNDKNKINIYKQVANYYYNNCTQKTFSTKEAAEEYIILRKPCLSMQDLKITGCLNEKQWNIILELVKHKSKL